MDRKTDEARTLESREGNSRIPGVPKHWQDFLVCILFHMLLPLLPIGFELFSTNTVTEKSLTLATAMYAVSIGGSSRSRLVFAFGIVVSLFFAIVYGFLVGQDPAQQNPVQLGLITSIAAWSLLGIFVSQLGERYNRHVADRTPYWDF